MSEMTLIEAQLYRLLSSFFGSDRVIWSMSALTVCGGELPKVPELHLDPEDLFDWAVDTRCLFTIIDEDDNPKMVVNFLEDFSQLIDIEKLENGRKLEPLLRAAGVRYIQINSSELGEIFDPESSYDLFAFLQERILGPDAFSSQECD